MQYKVFLSFVILRILLALFLCSCGEAVIGGVAVGALTFSKNSMHFLPSKEVYRARKAVKKEMHKSRQKSSNIEIIQADKVVYAIGTVPSTIIKNRITKVLDESLGIQYVDEIQVTTVSRNSLIDRLIKVRIKNKLLFTKFVRSQNYTIVVHNKRAFIFGKVKNTEEKEIVIHTLSQIEYIDDIIAYITTI